MRASAKLCQIVMLISMAIFHAFNAPAWCEESKATDCESLLDSTETAPLERITSDYLRCLVNAKMMNDFTPLAAVNNQIETAEQSRAKITYDPAKQETFWAVTIKDEHGLSQGDQDRVAERLKSILNDALEDSDVLTPEDREQVLANTKVQFGIPRKTPALADDAERDETPTDNPFSDEAPTEEEQLTDGNDEQHEKPLDDPLADDADRDETPTDDPFKDEALAEEEQLTDGNDEQHEKPLDDPFADDADRDETPTDDPFKDEALAEEEQLTDGNDEQHEKPLDDPFADDADRDETPTDDPFKDEAPAAEEQLVGDDEPQKKKPLDDPFADDAERDETPTDDPFKDEAPAEEEQLVGDDEQQKKKPLDNPFADDAERDETPTDDPFKDEAPAAEEQEEQLVGDDEQQKKKPLDNPFADDADRDETPTDDPFKDEAPAAEEQEEQLVGDDELQKKKPLDDPFADDADRDETPTDDPFKDEAPAEEEQLVGDDEEQKRKPLDDPFADDAERDETPTDDPFKDEAPAAEEQLTDGNEEQHKKPTGDSLADDAGGDKKLPGTRIPPKDTPLEEPPDSARVDELTGPMIEKMLKETINSGDEDDPDIPLIKDYLDPDSIQVVHNPQTRETEISILTRDGRNLTQQKDADLQAAVKNLWEHILERDVSSADDEHNGLVKGTSVDLGPNRIGPKPLQPNVKIVGEKADNGSTLTITAELDKPALEDSSVNVAVQVGGSPRTLTIAIPQGNSSEKVEVRMPDLIRNVITTGRPPRGEHVAFVSIIRVEGVAEPSLGEGGFAVVLGGTSTPSIDTVSHKTQAIEACNVCEPVTYCPTCRRRLGRR